MKGLIIKHRHDLESAELIIRAATRCRDQLAATIAANPGNPINHDLQLIADQAQHIIDTNERRN